MYCVSWYGFFKGGPPQRWRGKNKAVDTLHTELTLLITHATSPAWQLNNKRGCVRLNTEHPALQWLWALDWRGRGNRVVCARASVWRAQRQPDREAADFRTSSPNHCIVSADTAIVAPGPHDVRGSVKTVPFFFFCNVLARSHSKPLLLESVLSRIMMR